MDGHPHAGLPEEVISLFMSVEDMRTGYHQADPARQDELWSNMITALYAVSDRDLKFREWLISTYRALRGRLYWALRSHRRT